MHIAGQEVILTPKAHGGETITARGIITEKHGDTQTEINGNFYSVNAHLLLPLEYGDLFHIGDKVQAKHGKAVYLILTKVASPVDSAFSCDLTLFKYVSK